MTRPDICRHTSAADDIKMMGESGQHLLKPESSTPARLPPREIQGLRHLVAPTGGATRCREAILLLTESSQPLADVGPRQPARRTG